MNSTSFTAAGRTFRLQVDIPTRRAVRDATDGKIDLFAAFDGNLYAQLADPETLVDVLWAMAKDQAGDISPAEFGRSFRGDTIERAAEALQQAIADFFPTRQKALLTKAVEKGNAVMTEAMATVSAELDKPAAAATLSGNSTSSPASPVSTPIA